ncbi:unnamed protein product [Effrenium voratum]|nr:unnamed protein product [Effrenium voratum]
MAAPSAALVVASFATALCAEFAGAALGFGPAILYEISWQICGLCGLSSGGLEMAVFHILVQELPCGLLQLLLLRSFWRPRLAVLLNLPMLLALPVGTVLLERFGESPLAKQVLGGLFLALAAVQVHAKSRQKSKPDLEACSWGASASLALCSASSGLLRGAMGLAGPPFMVLLLFFSVEPSVWRCLSNTVRVTMVLTQGLLLGGMDHQLERQNWPIYVALMSGGVLGLQVGNRMAAQVDQSAFQRWLLLFLVAGGVLMLSSSSEFLSACSAVALALVVLGAIASAAFTWNTPQDSGGASPQRLLRCNEEKEEGCNADVPRQISASSISNV